MHSFTSIALLSAVAGLSAALPTYPSAESHHSDAYPSELLPYSKESSTADSYATEYKPSYTTYSKASSTADAYGAKYTSSYGDYYKSSSTADKYDDSYTSTYADYSKSSSTADKYDDSYTSTYAGYSKASSTADAYGAKYTSSYDDYSKSSSTADKYDDSYTSTYAGYSKAYSTADAYSTSDAYAAEYTASSVASAPFAGATHRVLAGFNGLHFEPENIVAEIGDLVEVHFNPMNHSFAQSSFDKPCVPISDDAIFSGFQPTMNGEAPNAFTIVVKDKNPLWFYCAQNKGAHCQMGMAMVVNQNFDGDKTLDNYKFAANTTTKVSVAPPKVGNGGVIAPPKMKFNGKA